MVSGGREGSGDEMGWVLILLKGTSFKGRTAPGETEPLLPKTSYDDRADV